MQRTHYGRAFTVQSWGKCRMDKKRIIKMIIIFSHESGNIEFCSAERLKSHIAA